MYDVVIIGGGPAGSTLARLIGDKMKVLLLERRNLSAPWSGGGFEKCCGGLVAPDAQKMLAEFGLGIPHEVLDGPQLFAVRTMDEKRDLQKYYQRHYINVDRERFDRWLFSLVPSGVEIECEAMFKSFEHVEEGVEVSYVKNNEIFKVRTKLLVGADGAFSKVRRILSPDHPMPRKYIAIQEYYMLDEEMPFYSSIFDKDVTDFYSWMIPKDGMLILGTALDPGENPLERFNILKTRLEKRGFHFGTFIRRNGAYLLRPGNMSEIHCGNGNVALIGEAAGWISPSSAEGLSYGFKSALALSEAIESNLQSAVVQYKRKTIGLGMNIRWKHFKSFVMYNDITRFMVMKSGLMAMKVRQGGRFFLSQNHDIKVGERLS